MARGMRERQGAGPWSVLTVSAIAFFAVSDRPHSTAPDPPPQPGVGSEQWVSCRRPQPEKHNYCFQIEVSVDAKEPSRRCLHIPAHPIPVGPARARGDVPRPSDPPRPDSPATSEAGETDADAVNVVTRV